MPLEYMEGTAGDIRETILDLSGYADRLFVRLQGIKIFPIVSSTGWNRAGIFTLPAMSIGNPDFVRQ